jgi:hypothetical protein
MLSRRSALLGFSATFAMPAIARAELLMPVRSIERLHPSRHWEARRVLHDLQDSIDK